jgi:hypothetical protein
MSFPDSVKTTFQSSNALVVKSLFSRRFVSSERKTNEKPKSRGNSPKEAGD